MQKVHKNNDLLVQWQVADDSYYGAISIYEENTSLQLLILTEETRGNLK